MARASNTVRCLGRITAAARFSYYAWLAASVVLKRPLPVIGGISITDACNLDCLHCWRKNQGRGHVPFVRIKESLENIFHLGARYLYIQGGEPFTWRDGDLRLQDVVHAATEIGFFHVTVCTNGTIPLAAYPDSFSLSIEGVQQSHDRIRCGSFSRIMANIEASDHPKMFANATFNRLNFDQLEPLAHWVKSCKKLQGILVNFHIPYPGVESLTLSMSQRAALAKQASRLKKRGYPILNTYRGLKALELNDWRRPLDLSVVTDCTQVYSCCRARGNDAICRECGYAGWAELAGVFEWDIISVLDVLRKMHRR